MGKINSNKKSIKLKIGNFHALCIFIAVVGSGLQLVEQTIVALKIFAFELGQLKAQWDGRSIPKSKNTEDSIWSTKMTKERSIENMVDAYAKESTLLRVCELVKFVEMLGEKLTF